MTTDNRLSWIPRVPVYSTSVQTKKQQQWRYSTSPLDVCTHTYTLHTHTPPRSQLYRKLCALQMQYYSFRHDCFFYLVRGCACACAVRCFSLNLYIFFQKAAYRAELSSVFLFCFNLFVLIFIVFLESGGLIRTLSNIA